MRSQSGNKKGWRCDQVRAASRTISLCQSRQGEARLDKAANAWRSVISLWTDIKIVIIVRVVGSCLGMTLIERLQIRQALPGSVITDRLIRS